MEYTFTLKYQLTEDDSDPDGLVERLGEAGCDDALVGIGQPGRLALEFTREADSADAAVRSAKFVDELIEMPWDGFAPGTESGAPTNALPDIWKDRATFDKLAKDAKAETVKLVAAAGTDLAALRAQVQATGRACKSCHDKFQKE